MTVETTEPDGAEILRAIRLRLERLRPLVEECKRLEVAEAKLDGALGKLAGINGDAPHGYKADGTPRKRRAMPAGSAQRGWQTRRANAAKQ